MLDVTGFAANPAAPGLGGLGICHVRCGKAMRGSPPRRRAVAAVMPWAAEVLARYIDDRFAAWRAAAGLPGELSVHCLRHSYGTRLINKDVPGK